MRFSCSRALRSVAALLTAIACSSHYAAAQKSVGPLPFASNETADARLEQCEQNGSDYYNAGYAAAQDSIRAGQVKAFDYAALGKLQKQIVRRCVMKIDDGTYSGPRLLALALMYVRVGEHEAVQRATARYLTEAGKSDSARADALSKIAVRYTFPGELNPAHADSYADQLDALPASVNRQKQNAHEQLFSRYQSFDLDLGAQKHALAVINLARRLKVQALTAEHPALDSNRIEVSELMTMYQTAANVDGNFGREANAIKLLEQARHDHPEISKALFDSALGTTMSLLKLTGQPAAAIETAHWFNAPAEMRAANLSSNVTVVGFTAHWCPPCQVSYAPLKTMADSLAPSGVRFMLVSTFYGFVGNKRNLKADQELEETRSYYQKRNITFPIAMLGDGYAAAKFERREMPAPFETYRVEQIPQTVVIDRHGRIRRIIVGWDPANSERLPAFINTLLREK